MATEAVLRPHVDQENPNPLNFKGGNASGITSATPLSKTLMS